jgi:hypothetical protein
MADSLNIVHSTGAGAVIIQDGRRRGPASPGAAVRDPAARAGIAESGEAGDRAATAQDGDGPRATAASPELASPAAPAGAGDERSTTATAAELARAVATLARRDGARGKKLGRLHRELMEEDEYRAAFVALGIGEGLPRRAEAWRPVTRTGKIARLPHLLRQEVNRRLQQGQTGKLIVAWLNAQPEAVVILARHWRGHPITEKSLSEWRKGGYQDWLKSSEGHG